MRDRIDLMQPHRILTQNYDRTESIDVVMTGDMECDESINDGK
jgi:hypothetical protein